MVLLRRAISGESRIELEQPWATVVHCYGEFVIDGWKLTGFKRNYDIKYLDAAVSPDGRMGTYRSWNAREGNPVHLLTDDEQDRPGRSDRKHRCMTALVIITAFAIVVLVAVISGEIGEFGLRQHVVGAARSPTLPSTSGVIRLLHRGTICGATFKMRLPVKRHMALTRALHPSSASLHLKNGPPCPNAVPRGGGAG